MKKFICAFLCLLMLLLPLTVYAEGDPNMDNGGGGTEDGTKENSWNVGNDGVRVTVVREKDKKPMTTPVDFSNKKITLDFYFGLNNKINYKKGINPKLTVGSSYKNITPASPLPTVVSANGGVNISAVKNYFRDKSTIKYICEKVGFDYEELINGEYVLMIEPLVYITYNDIKFCMTATEAALYDRMTSGDLRAKLGNITHQNLPLAMFLEKPDLGFPAWGGATSGICSNEDIISSLGIGTVRFTEQEENPKDDDTPPAGTKMYEYHTDTDVITTIEVKDTKGGKSGISPDDKAKVTFRVGSKSYVKQFVVPPHESTPIWIKWHTPSKPQKVTINVSTTHGQVTTPTVIANVTELTESTPPDPQARDTNPQWRLPRVPRNNDVTKLTWGEWLPKWHKNMEWESDWQWKKKGHNSNCKPDCTKSHGGKWVDKGKYVDNGWWIYTWREYYASLGARLTVKPDSRVPSVHKGAYNTYMKSGYGINIEIQPTYGGNGKNGDTTSAQNAIATFPEFDYQTYNRVLERDIGKLQLKENGFSQVRHRVHFTPLWYPDDTEYQVQVELIDCWTPAGMLSVSKNNDHFIIDGNVYDDWRWVGY